MENKDYFYIVTVRYSQGVKNFNATYTGVISIKDGKTQREIYKGVMNVIEKKEQLPENYSIIYYYLLENGS